MLMKHLVHPSIHSVETVQLKWVLTACKLKTYPCYRRHQAARLALPPLARVSTTSLLSILSILRSPLYFSVLQHMPINLTGYNPAWKLLDILPLHRFVCVLIAQAHDLFGFIILCALVVQAKRKRLSSRFPVDNNSSSHFCTNSHLSYS